MTTYFVGKMGNDNNSGRTWGTRLATINGAEDLPVVPGDFVWIAPGVYRETHTIDVSGVAGRPITFAADVTGENTDGVGGPVRITGSNNDQTTARGNCISLTDKNYRIFRGFHFDTCSAQLVNVSAGTNITVEDCSFQNANVSINWSGVTSDCITRRCIFMGGQAFGSVIRFFNVATIDDTNSLVENCIVIIKQDSSGIRVDRVGGVSIRNVLLISGVSSIHIGVALAVGQTLTVNNCIILYADTALSATVVGEIIENYNTLYGNGTDRLNTNVGANSQTYPPIHEMPLLDAGDGLISGFRLPWWFSSLSRWSQVRQITGANEPDEDLFGLRRPFTHGGPVASLASWGPIQWTDFRRDTLRSHDGSLSARIKQGQKTWMFVPGISATQHIISAWSYRTAGYGGQRNPEMVIKQPGQADRRTVAGGAAGAWVQTSDTFTPAADPPWLTVELWNQCDFTTTTTVSTTSTTTLSTTSTSTVTVTTLTTTTTTLACDVWWDDIQVT